MAGTPCMQIKERTLVEGTSSVYGINIVYAYDDTSFSIMMYTNSTTQNLVNGDTLLELPIIPCVSAFFTCNNNTLSMYMFQFIDTGDNKGAVKVSNAVSSGSAIRAYVCGMHKGLS